MIGDHEKVCIPVWRLCQLEDAYKELKRANDLIARLRAENKVLKDEKRRFFSMFDALKKHISISGNPAKKWAVTFVKAKMQSARLI